MQVLLNSKKEILAYAIVGDIDGSVQIDDTQIPRDFEADFKPLYFVLENGKVIENEEFEEIEEKIDAEVPTLERIAQLENLVLQLLSGGDEL
ncbi:DUF2977 domain-containing protein [Brochothrix thermosphacta]|uniref:Phage-like protein n=1 Tax=Brochothrix thermosphacta TaxID=2756 RepID=A0A2X0QW88_BROTH|nr:DUF2977 domain-containing protein [Brochothrix thermosphacta]SPP25724.1 Phage-like protein [Brochothrix thermosphacta]SPP28398.1 Phage-like protein [Brochothrix thermosphacta]